jgi:toxin HigB-1
MDLYFADQQLAGRCASRGEIHRLWGAQCAQVICRRLEHLASADDLSVIAAITPARLRRLDGARDGQWAIDAFPPVRLVFEPYAQQMRLRPDGAVDMSRVTAIRILGIEEDHGS